MLLLLGSAPYVSTVAPVVVELVVGDPAPVEAEPATVELEAVVGAATGGPATVPGERTPLRIRRVERSTGALIEELDRANVTSIEWTKNDVDSPVVEFDLPAGAASTAPFEPLRTEIQVRADGHHLAWGVVVDDASSSSSTGNGYTARNRGWYLRRRFFGSSIPTNRITNGSFEADGPSGGFEGWTEFGVSPRSGIYGNASPAPFGYDLPPPKDGDHAFFSLGAPWSERGLRTSFPITFTGRGPTKVTLDAFVNLAYFTGAARNGYGLALLAIVNGELLAWNTTRIDYSTRWGWGRAGLAAATNPYAVPDVPEDLDLSWIPVGCSLEVPNVSPDVAPVGFIEARLYFPGGLVAWDHVVARAPEAFAPDWRGEDQALFAGRMVEYAQNAPGKGDLGIGRNTPATGIILGPGRARYPVFDHARHQFIADGIAEVAAAADGFDFDVVTTPTTTTFRTHYPRGGVDRRETLILKLGRPEDGGNLKSADRTRDGVPVATSIVVTAQGTDADGNPVDLEGYASDTTATDGLVLEDVVAAPTGSTTPRDLDADAAAELAARSDLIPVLSLVTSDPTLLHYLRPCDLVTVEYQHLSATVSGAYEVVRVKLTDPHKRTLALTVNRWDG